MTARNIFSLAILFLTSAAGYSFDSSLREFADGLANLDKEFESVYNEEKFNPFSPRQRKIFEKRDQLYQRISEHIEKKILSKDFDDIVPFLRTEISSIRNLTFNKVRDFLSDNAPEKSCIQEKLLLFLIDHSDEDHGSLLLEVCSRNPLCRNVLKPHLKKILLTKTLHPFLLEFSPELYQCEEIASLFEIRNERILRDAFYKFSSQKKVDFKDYFCIAGLLLLARNGNKFAEDKYFLFISTLKDPVPYRVLAGCAIISSRRSFDFLFDKLSDFRTYSYSGHPVSGAAVSLLQKTIVDFPPGPGKWFSGPFVKKDAMKYIDWTKDNKESYKVKELTPYDLFALTGLSGMDRKKEGKDKLSVNTRRGSIDNAPVLDFRETQEDKSPRLTKLSNEIIQKEIIKNSCALTEEETRAAVQKYLEAEDFSVTTFSKASSMMVKLIEGLRLVAEKNEKPDAVYLKLKLADHGISKGNWAFYCENYRSSEKIDLLEQWIPNNSDVIIKSASIQFKPMMERFLLERFILFDFDIKNKDKISLSDPLKKVAWWTETLDHYRLDQQEKNAIMPFLVCFSIADRQKEIFNRIFSNRSLH